MGIKFWKFVETVPENWVLMPLKTPKIAYFAFLGMYVNFEMPYEVHFSQKNKILLKPIRMVIEGPTFQFLASGTPTRARDTIFPKDRLSSETRFTSKMCSFSVQNDKIRSKQRSIFVKVFGYDRGIRKCLNNFIWVLIRFPRQKNIISRHAHIMDIHDMMLKTRSRANITYVTRLTAQICMAPFSLMFLYMIGVHIKCLTILFGF